MLFKFSSSVSLLVAAVVVLPGLVLGVVSQGTVNITRDYLIEYDTSLYPNTHSFCQEFRHECEVFNEFLINQHHQLDCVFSQPGPQIRAFCGGITRNLITGVVNKQGTVHPFTAAMIWLVKGAKIVGPPVASTPQVSHKPASKGKKHKEKQHGNVPRLEERMEKAARASSGSIFENEEEI